MVNKKAKQKNIQSAINLFQQGKLDHATECLIEIIDQWKENAQAWFLLATIHLQNSQLEEAKQAFENAIKHQIKYPDAYNNLGVVNQALNNNSEAEKCYRNALKQRPDYANAHYNLGQILQSKGLIDNAIEHYLLAIKFQPKYVKALNNLAMLYQSKGYNNKAKNYYLSAIKLSPSDPEILNNYGFTLYSNHEYQGALESFNKVLKIIPEFHDTFLNIGLVLQATGDLEAAKIYFQKASKNPRLAFQANHNIAHLELSRENYAQGWDYYRFRPSTRGNNQEIPINVTGNGNSQRILLVKDQGIGDELFFLRFLPELQKQVSEIAYYCDEKLQPLLSRNLSNCEFLATMPDKNNFDTVIPIADLPRFVSHQSDIPLPVKLQPESSRLDEVFLHLPNNKLPNIAVTWQAGIQGDNKLFKRIPPDELGHMLSNINANIIILQRNPNPKDIKLLEKGLKRKVFNYSYINESLDNTLAFLSIVDSYIGVSNTNMHLMASLRKNAFVFIPHPPEWRWLYQGDSSPWFPEFKLYRQNVAGQWEKALNLCHDSLNSLYN